MVVWYCGSLPTPTESCTKAAKKLERPGSVCDAQPQRSQKVPEGLRDLPPYLMFNEIVCFKDVPRVEATIFLDEAGVRFCTEPALFSTGRK